MSPFEPGSQHMHPSDTAPGDERLDRVTIAAVRSYLIGLGLATLLTIASFFVSRTTLVWTPSIPVALVVLAIAQMGVHLVFFLHITTGPDNVNNVMALAFGVLIVLLLLTGSLWVMANLNHNMGFKGEVMEMQPEGGSGIRPVTASGVIAPTATAPVNARVSGVIQSLDCNVDMQVKAGQICAKIDPRPYQMAIDQSRAGLQASQAQLEKDKAILSSRRSALERRETLAERRAISPTALAKSRQSLETAQKKAERGQAKVAALQAALHAAETNLAATDIVSPLDGIVVSRNVESGQTVAAGSETPLFVIARDRSIVHIDAAISAEDSRGVALGSRATFTVAAFPDRQFSGVVTHIGPSRQIDERASTTDVVITAPNPDLLLQPGMPATIRIAPK